MEIESIKAIARELHEAGVRFLVVGGLAVVAHGYVRGTKDMDLVFDLAPENLERAIAALSRLGYQPLVPVPFADYAKAEERRRWVEEKDAVVFQIFSDRHPSVRIDLFLSEPFSFAEVYGRAAWQVIAEIPVPFVPLDELLTMKEKAARPQDLADIHRLGIEAARRARDAEG
jgi:predicted nucleotidyltransferase